MKKIHIILLYTSEIVHPKNTNIYSIIKSDSNFPSNYFHFTFSEIENVDGESLKYIFKNETIKNNDADYSIGLDLDYVCIPFSKLKDIIISFLNDEIDFLDTQFLCGLKKPSFIKKPLSSNKNSKYFDESCFDSFELLNARELKKENLYKIQNGVFSKKILFLDFYIKYDDSPIFTNLPTPILGSSSPYNYISFGKDGSFHYSIGIESIKSIIFDILDYENDYSFYLLRFVNVYDENEVENNEIEISSPYAPKYFLDNNYFYIFGARNDIYKFLIGDKEINHFLNERFNNC